MYFSGEHLVAKFYVVANVPRPAARWHVSWTIVAGGDDLHALDGPDAVDLFDVRRIEILDAIAS